MSCRSFAEDLSGYAAERLLVARIVLLWLLMTVLAAWLDGRAGPGHVVVAAALLAALIVQFRIWDDHADRARDAIAHPARVMVITDHASGFARLTMALALPIGAGLAAHAGAQRLLVYGLLLTGFALLYSRNPNRLPRLLRAHLVLVKYPVFLGLAAPGAMPLRLAYSAAVLFLFLALFEIASDRLLREGRAWRQVAALEALLLGGFVLFLRP